MTPQLTALVRALECPICNGCGTLAWASEGRRHERNVILCGVCDGDGLNPTHAEAIRLIERSL